MNFQILLGLSKDLISQNGDMHSFTDREKSLVGMELPIVIFFQLKLDFFIDDIISLLNFNLYFFCLRFFFWGGVTNLCSQCHILNFIRSYNLLDNQYLIEMDFHGPFFQSIIHVHTCLKSAYRKQCLQTH